MRRPALCFLLLLTIGVPTLAQQSSDPVAQAIAQGDLYQSKRKYELALDAYHRADKLAHHSSASCYLKIANIDRKLGDFSSALDNTKKAIKVAGDDKAVAVKAYLTRSTILAAMAGKPTDKKLREAEDEIRQALALDPANSVALFDLGFVLLKQERDPEGIAELNKYLGSAKPDPATVSEARRLIANPVRARSPFAPDFAFTTDDRQQLSNASLRGKVVLLDFWGTWCPPCRESVPVIRELNKHYAGKPFQIVGISSDDDEEVWKTFIAQQKMDWAEYIDLQGTVLEAFKIESFPTYVVLDKDGVVRFRQSGFGSTTEGELSDAINKCLKRDSDPKLVAALAAESAAASPTVSQRATPPVSAVPTIAAASSPAVVAPSDTHSRPERHEPQSGSSSTALGVEDGVVSGNVYRNRALRLRYEFPPNWIAVKAETLESANERSEASMKAAIEKQHPELAGGANISIPKMIFYASRKGAGDGQRIEMPSVRITALPVHGGNLSLDGFQQTVTKMAAASTMQIMNAPTIYTVEDHPFYRADLERSTGAKFYTAFVQTLAGEYILNIELFAYSPEELKQVTSSLGAMAIDDDKP